MDLRALAGANIHEQTGIFYVSPDPENSNFIAKSDDYVLVMHFFETFKDRMKGYNVTEELVDNIF